MLARAKMTSGRGPRRAGRPVEPRRDLQAVLGRVADERGLHELAAVQVLRHVVRDLSGRAAADGDGPQVAAGLVVRVGVDDLLAVGRPGQGASHLAALVAAVDAVALGELDGLAAAVGGDQHDVEVPALAGRVGDPLAVRGEVGVVLVPLTGGEHGGLAGGDVDDADVAPPGAVGDEGDALAVGRPAGVGVVVVLGVGRQVASGAAGDGGDEDVHALVVGEAAAVRLEGDPLAVGGHLDVGVVPLVVGDEARPDLAGGDFRGEGLDLAVAGGAAAGEDHLPAVGRPSSPLVVAAGAVVVGDVVGGLRAIGADDVEVAGGRGVAGAVGDPLAVGRPGGDEALLRVHVDDAAVVGAVDVDDPEVVAAALGGDVGDARAVGRDGEVLDLGVGACECVDEGVVGEHGGFGERGAAVVVRSHVTPPLGRVAWGGAILGTG